MLNTNWRRSSNPTYFSHPESTDPSSDPDSTNPSSYPDSTNPSSHPDPTNPSSHPDPTDPSSHPDPTDPSSHPDSTNPSSNRNLYPLNPILHLQIQPLLRKLAPTLASFLHLP